MNSSWGLSPHLAGALENEYATDDTDFLLLITWVSIVGAGHVPSLVQIPETFVCSSAMLYLLITLPSGL